MKKLLKIAGILACIAALGLNLQYAMNGYGIKSGKMHLEVFAQSGSSGSGGGSGSSSSTNTGYVIHKYNCSYGGTAEVNSTVRIGIVSIKVGLSGKWSFFAANADVQCELNGTFLCTPQNCPLAIISSS